MSVATQKRLRSCLVAFDILMFIELLSVICSNRGRFCVYLRLNVVTDANSEAFNLIFLLVQSAKGVVQFDIDIHCVTG